MFQFLRLRYLSTSLQQLKLTGRLFSDVVSFWQAVALGRWLRRGVAVALMAIALWCGAAVPAPVAQAAATPEAEADGFNLTTSRDSTDPGPIRQTRNPLSDENFHGGVDDSALEKTENRRLPEDDDKGLLETLKDKVTGNDTKESPADLKTEKNPTLERYSKSLD